MLFSRCPSFRLFFHPGHSYGILSNGQLYILVEDLFVGRQLNKDPRRPSSNTSKGSYLFSLGANMLKSDRYFSTFF